MAKKKKVAKKAAKKPAKKVAKKKVAKKAKKKVAGRRRPRSSSSGGFAACERSTSNLPNRYDEKETPGTADRAFLFSWLSL